MPNVSWKKLTLVRKMIAGFIAMALSTVVGNTGSREKGP
jgi:hypothetical protein